MPRDFAAVANNAVACYGGDNIYFHWPNRLQ